MPDRPASEHDQSGQIKPQPRGLDRPSAPLPSRPINTPRPEVQYKSIDAVDDDELIDEQVIEDDQPDDAPSDGHRKKSRKLTKVEMLAGVALAAVAVLIAVTYLPDMIARGTADPAVAVTTELPLINHELTITEITPRWAEVHEGDRPAWFPEFDITVGPAANGVVRVFFINNVGVQIGDTQTFVVKNGSFDSSGSPSTTIRCSSGVIEKLHLKDMRVRQGEEWSVRLMNGPSTNARLSEFSRVIQLRIPWEFSSPPIPAGTANGDTQTPSDTQ